MSERCKQMDNELVGETEAEIANLKARLAATEQQAKDADEHGAEHFRKALELGAKALALKEQLQRAEQRAADLAAQVGELRTALEEIWALDPGSQGDTYVADTAIGLANATLARTPAQAGERWRKERAVVEIAREYCDRRDASQADIQRNWERLLRALAAVDALAAMKRDGEVEK